MDKRDDLTKICDELASCKNKLCVKNEIVCAKKILKQYAGEDRNKLLKLRALAKIYDDGEKIGFFTYLSSIMSTLTFCLVIIYNTSPVTPTGEKDLSAYLIFGLLSFLLIIVIAMLPLIYGKRYASRRKWRRYIDIAIDEILKDE